MAVLWRRSGQRCGIGWNLPNVGQLRSLQLGVKITSRAADDACNGGDGYARDNS